jgi:hypothetical protein
MAVDNYKVGSVIRHRFNTRKFDNTPVTFAGSPAISIYKNSVTESTAGVTLIVDYDSRTGLHYLTIDTSTDPTFYVSGEDYDAIVTSGTVDSVSVVGEKVYTFCLENRFINSALSEIGQGNPSANASLVDMIRYLYKAWRNKKTQTSTQYSLYADNGSTIDQKATVSDDGTTTTVEEIQSGP